MAVYRGDQLVSYSLGQLLSFADGAITTAKIEDGAVTTPKLADSSFSSSKIADEAVTNSKIADSSLVNADFSNTAAIAGSKISSDFGSQNVSTTGNLVTPKINGGPIGGWKNFLVNGNFIFWQRSTSTTSTAQGFTSCDMWGVWTAGGTGRAATISRETFANGQTEVGGNPVYYFRWNESTIGSSYTDKTLWTVFEEIDFIAGKEVTLSWWMKANAARTVNVITGYDYGNGGSTYTEVARTDNFQTTTSWQKFTLTFTMPSISGKTVGDGPLTWLGFKLPVNQTFIFDIANVQLELGPVATDFELRQYPDQLRRVMRYYQYHTLNSGGSIRSKWSGSTARSQAFNAIHQFPVPMYYPVATQVAAPSYANCSALGLTNYSGIPDFCLSVTARVTTGAAIADYYSDQYEYAFAATL